jgi:paraquat-inducible protein A
VSSRALRRFGSKYWLDPNGRAMLATDSQRRGVIHIIACMDCDLLHSLGTVPEGATARCRRCAGVLRRRPRNSLEHTLALALSAAILFIVANSFPFLSFEMKGRITETTVMTGIIDLYNGGKWEIAALVLLTIELAPVAQLAMLLYVLVPLRANRVPWQLPRAFRMLRHAQSWSMIEVFMIGIIVAITKLMGMATIVPGLAIWAFGLLMLVLAGAMSSFDPESVWERVEALQ